DAAGAPCASIWKVEEVIDHPQIVERGAIQEIDTPYGRLRFAGSGFRLAHGGGRLDRMAPEPRAPTDEVLSSLGYGEGEIRDLRTREIIWTASPMAAFSRRKMPIGIGSTPAASHRPRSPIGAESAWLRKLGSRPLCSPLVDRCSSWSAADAERRPNGPERHVRAPGLGNVRSPTAP